MFPIGILKTRTLFIVKIMVKEKNENLKCIQLLMVLFIDYFFTETINKTLPEGESVIV